MSQAVVLIGPPGVGKGEVRKRLIREAGFHGIEVSNLIVSKKAKDPVFSEYADQLMSSGQLLDNSHINSLLETAVRGVSPFRSIVVDGSCRNKDQAVFLRKILLENGFQITFILFELSEEECAKRMLNRVASGEQRSDDTREVHAGRMKIYREEIDHVLAYLGVCGAFFKTVDASGTIDDVYYNVVSLVLGEHMVPK